MGSSRDARNALHYVLSRSRLSVMEAEDVEPLAGRAPQGRLGLTSAGAKFRFVP
jgi:hypothetical protein